VSTSWSRKVAPHEVGRGGLSLALEADADQRAGIARDLGLHGLSALTAEVRLQPWLDGVQLTGRFSAEVEQICGVSLEPFSQALAGALDVRIVPAGSANAPDGDAEETELRLDSPDPPDVLEAEAIDLAGYVVEHLALEIDPFPRKPGVEFAFAAPDEDMSPFAALGKLRNPKP
jgi:Large ribosomal RNA subunit accumulation protein YceD